jgi:lactate dehydrogenase-like 2-hydroxyacid dehydrogenase
VVSLHLAYTPESHGLISRALLERMKPGAWFVNTARARLVDNEALADLLRAGRLRGARRARHGANARRLCIPNAPERPHHAAHRLQHRGGVVEHAAIAIVTVEAFARGERLHVVNGVWRETPPELDRAGTP